MDNATIQKLKDALAKSRSIGIAVGENPSIDEMGAALSLYLLLRNANKSVSVASPVDPIVEISSLVGIDRVQRKFGGDAGDLVVSFPYHEGEIEKVSYTLENNFLNIIVKASERGLSFDAKDVRYNRGSGSIDLLIVIGAAKLSDIGDVIDSQKLSNISVINIDNDLNNQRFGDIVLVSENASSVSEHVGDIALILGFAIDPDSAQNLLSGIMSATNNFQSPKSSPLAFEIASIAMKSGARRTGSQSVPSFRQAGVPAGSVNQTVAAQQAFGSASRQNNIQKPQSVVNQPVQSGAMPETNERVELSDDQREKPPLDWLTPKVYKGSSEV
jgi:hypothetical protein